MLWSKHSMIPFRQLSSSRIYPGKQWQTQYLYIWKHCALVMEQTLASSHIMYLPVKWIVFLHYSYCIYYYFFDIILTVTSSGKTWILFLSKPKYLLHIKKICDLLAFHDAQLIYKLLSCRDDSVSEHGLNHFISSLIVSWMRLREYLRSVNLNIWKLHSLGQVVTVMK